MANLQPVLFASTLLGAGEEAKTPSRLPYILSSYQQETLAALLRLPPETRKLLLEQLETCSEKKDKLISLHDSGKLPLGRFQTFTPEKGESAVFSQAAKDLGYKTEPFRVAHAIIPKSKDSGIISADDVSYCLELSFKNPKSQQIERIHLTEGMAFDVLSSLLGGKYKILEQKKLGKEIVVVLLDQHITEAEEENQKRVAFLEKQFDLQLVGIENFVDAPGSAVEKEVNAYFEKVLRWEKEQVWIPKQDPRAAGTVNPDYEPNLTHAKLFEVKDYKAVGVEDKQQYQRIALAGKVEEAYNGMMDTILALPTDQAVAPISLDGKYHPFIYSFVQAQNELKKHFPDFPLFDLDKLGTISGRKSKAIVLKKENMQYIGLMAMQFREWMNSHVIAERNPTIAENLLSQMRTSGYNRGALIVGADHGAQELNALTRRKVKPVQGCLAEKNVSYIVLGKPNQD